MKPALMKRIALAILMVPIGILLLFTFGETFSGDLSGLSHLLQLAPILLLTILAWKKPFWGGATLSALSLALGVYYLVAAHQHPLTNLVVETLLFLPPFVSGILLILSAKKKSKPTPTPQTQ